MLFWRFTCGKGNKNNNKALRCIQSGAGRHGSIIWESCQSRHCVGQCVSLSPCKSTPCTFRDQLHRPSQVSPLRWERMFEFQEPKCEKIRTTSSSPLSLGRLIMPAVECLQWAADPSRLGEERQQRDTTGQKDGRTWTFFLHVLGTKVHLDICCSGKGGRKSWIEHHNELLVSDTAVARLFRCDSDISAWMKYLL